MIPNDAQAIYTIEASQSITGPWAPLGTIGGTDGEMEFTDLTGPATAARFYRVRGD